MEMGVFFVFLRVSAEPMASTAPLAPRIYEGGARRAGGVLTHCEFAEGFQ